MSAVLVPLVDPSREPLLSALAFTVAATETVDSYCVDYLLHDSSALDVENLLRERVDHVTRTLTELDEIVRVSLDHASIESSAPAVAVLLGDTVARARSLALAIRGALAETTRPRLPRQARPASNPYADEAAGL